MARHARLVDAWLLFDLEMSRGFLYNAKPVPLEVIP